jgi:hypothetical protein
VYSCGRYDYAERFSSMCLRPVETTDGLKKYHTSLKRIQEFLKVGIFEKF